MSRYQASLGTGLLSRINVLYIQQTQNLGRKLKIYASIQY